VLPYVGGKNRIMKPFRVELLAKDAIIKEFLREFPAKKLKLLKDSSDSSFYYYSASLDLSPIWNDSIDLIRITWNINVQVAQQSKN
jgi:hypothetical protein